MATEIPSLPGTYTLILQLPRDLIIPVGRLGPVPFRMGHYLYVGSARGPGGLRARLGRHLRLGKRRHWHIDYLRQHARPVEVWFTIGEKSFECHWRALLQEAGLSLPVPGFGASDCRCPAHLLYSREWPLPGLRELLSEGSRSVQILAAGP